VAWVYPFVIMRTRNYPMSRGAASLCSRSAQPHSAKGQRPRHASEHGNRQGV